MPGRLLSPPSSPVVSDGNVEPSSPWIVEYYDEDDECYWGCVANPEPAEEGYSIPDVVVRSLDSERHRLRSENMTLMTDNTYLKEENKRLTGEIESLKKQVAESYSGRAITARRLRCATQRVRILEMKIKTKDTYATRGMRRIREAYAALELAVMESEDDEVPEAEPSVPRETGVLGAGGSSTLAGAEPVEDLSEEAWMYPGWVF